MKPNDTKEAELRRLASLSPKELTENIANKISLSLLEEEQQAIVLGSAWAKALMQRDDVKKVAATMITARQIYAVAYAELQRLIEIDKDSLGIHDMAEDIIVQSSAYAASKPFSDHALMQGIQETTLPTLADIIDRHSEMDEETVRQFREEEEKQRRVRPIEIGISVDAEDESTKLPRDRSLTLVGNYLACRLLADYIVNKINEAEKGNFTILWLADSINYKAQAPDITVLRFNKKLWSGCTNNGKAFQRFVGAKVLPFTPASIDLVICSDLTNAFTSTYSSRDPFATAGDAHKQLATWCKNAGAALLCFIPQQEDSVELNNPALEQLRTFSNVRKITVSGSYEKEHKISVGTGHWSLQAGYDELQEYSTLQVPLITTE